jgi:DDE superfamily endonuclease
MRPTPGPPDTQDGVGAGNDPTGATVVRCRRRQRRREVAERWQALVDTPPTGTIDVAWDHAATHAEQEVEAVVRAEAGRLVRRYVPTDRPWLNPMAMRWRHCRREVTHGALFVALDAGLKAAHAFLDRDHQDSARGFSIIGAHAAYLSWVYLGQGDGWGCGCCGLPHERRSWQGAPLKEYPQTSGGIHD